MSLSSTLRENFYEGINGKILLQICHQICYHIYDEKCDDKCEFLILIHEIFSPSYFWAHPRWSIKVMSRWSASIPSHDPETLRSHLSILFSERSPLSI